MRLLVGSYPHQVAAYVGGGNYVRYFGMLVTPRDRKTPEKAVEVGAAWAIDNFAYTDWRVRPFINLLNDYEKIPGCLWCAAPDVPKDAAATLQKFPVWQEIIRSYGYPVALVTQDGMQSEDVPWSLVDCLFIAGSDEWRFGTPGIALIQEAKRLGKQIHIGRVNSIKRLRACQALGADTVDGSGYAKFSKLCLEHLPALQKSTLSMQFT